MTLPRELQWDSWQYLFAIRVSEWLAMESTDARRIHSKEKTLLCKEWCVYCSYTHRLSKRKRNWHFVCVPLWFCFVKLKTNILGQSHLLFAALVCVHNKTRTGLRTTCFLQSRGCEAVIPILNNICYEFTIRRHWMAERSYSIVVYRYKILGLNIWEVNLKTCIHNWIFVAINVQRS